MKQQTMEYTQNILTLEYCIFLYGYFTSDDEQTPGSFLLSKEDNSKCHFTSDTLKCTSFWRNCLQHSGNDAFKTKVQVLQVKHISPSGLTERTNKQGQITMKWFAHKSSPS